MAPRGARRSSKKMSMPVEVYLRRRRLRVTITSIGGLLILLVLMLLDRTGAFAPHGGVRQQYHQQTFMCVYVIDGDTLDVAVPGAKEGKRRIRLWGVDTPETAHAVPGGEMWADEATQLTRELCEGKQVTLALEPHDFEDKYGRILAYVQLPDGTWLNEHLLVAGLAVADRRFSHQHMRRYQLLEQQAQKQELGIWSRKKSAASGASE